MMIQAGFDLQFLARPHIVHDGVDVVTDDFSGFLEMEAKLPGSVAGETGFQLIGHFALDETGYWSARAHSYFDQYPSHGDLPRTMYHWSHSKYGDCG